MLDKFRKQAQFGNQPSKQIILMPTSAAALEKVRQRCRLMVAKKAILSAGASALPVFGIDIVIDIRLLSRLIEQINAEFGMTPEQIEALQPEFKVALYSTVIRLGSTLVGRAVTRDLLLKMLTRSSVKLVSKNATRLVPVAGQLVSAAIGFSAFRMIGNRHIEACVAVADKMLELQSINK